MQLSLHLFLTLFRKGPKKDKEDYESDDGDGMEDPKCQKAIKVIPRDVVVILPITNDINVGFHMAKNHHYYHISL